MLYEVITSRILSPLNTYAINDLLEPLTSLGVDDKGLKAKYLCGITTPLFNRIKNKQNHGFGSLENYRFSDVLNVV